MPDAQLAVVICTHDRVTDALVNQEIIRYHWSNVPELDNAVIIHSYNGANHDPAIPYLENDLLRSPNSNLSQGNADLIDQGLLYLHQHYPQISYAVVLNADTWLIEPAYVQRLLQRMQREELLLAASSYAGEKSEFYKGGIASDFFVVHVPFAITHKMIPLNYKDFQERFMDLILYYSAEMSPILEKLLFARFAKALFNAFPCQNPGDLIKTKLLRMREREPFYERDSDTDRVWYWPEAGVVSDHDLWKKKALLEQAGITTGKYVGQLLYRSDLHRGYPEIRNE